MCYIQMAATLISKISDLDELNVNNFGGYYKWNIKSLF